MRRRAAPLLILLALCAAAACRQASVSEAERAMLLRAGDLVPYGIEPATAAAFGPSADHPHETFSKTVYFDGAAEIDYEFEPPDGSLYLSVTATFEKNRTDALVSKGVEKTALQAGMGIGGLKLEEKKGFFSYGDDSSFYALTREGQPVGNFFITREGAKLYTVVIIGAHFDDPEEWAALVTPRLQKFSAHKP